MAVINTQATTTKWLPYQFVCSVQDGSTDLSKPKRGYTWKYKGSVVDTTAEGTYDVDFIDDGDKIGWSCEVRGYAENDDNFSGESVEIGTENFTLTLFDNEYVEDVIVPKSFNVGDELRAKLVYKIVIPANMSTDLYYNDGLIASVDGDPGDVDHIWFNIAKFAWEQYSGKYRMEITDDHNTVKFRYVFSADIRENPAVFNAQKHAPSYFVVNDEPPIDDQKTIVRYRLERTTGELVYESTNKTVFVSKSTQPEHAGEYIACVRAYKASDTGDIVSTEFSEGQRHQFVVNVKENEFFDDSYVNQQFRYPSGSSVNITISTKQADSRWLKHYGLITQSVYFRWVFGKNVIKNTLYGNEGYGSVSLNDLQYDNSVDLQLMVAKIESDDPHAQPVSRPLFYSSKRLDIYDVEHDLGNIEVGEPIVLKITDPEPPKSQVPHQVRSLAILKDDRVIANIPLDSKEYQITDSADREHIGLYSHEFRDSPSNDPNSAHDEYDIVSRETYRVNVVPNMEFEGPNHVVIEVGQELVLEATMLKEPSNYVPTYEFSKDGQKLAILDNHNPVYRKANAQKSDSGFYKFVAFADKNGNGNIDPDDVIGYTKYVHVIVKEPVIEPEDPHYRPVEIVTLFNSFSKGLYSPCPYWVIDELVELMADPRGWSDKIEDSVYYNWQITIFNEFLKGKDLYLQDSCNGYWAIVKQRDMTIETGYGRFKHYPDRRV